MTSFSRLLGQVVAVRDLDPALGEYERLGFTICDRSPRPEWGIDTVMFAFPDGCYLELVSPLDRWKDVGATVGGFVERWGQGLYMTVIEVPDVHDAHRALTASGVPVVGPPVAAPEARGIPCDLLWLRPRATAGAFVQLLSYRRPHQEVVLTPWARSLANQAIAVSDLEHATATFAALGLEPWDRSERRSWGLGTVTYRLTNGSGIELVTARDPSKAPAAAVSRFTSHRSGGHYMTVIEVDDVDQLYDRLVASGIPTLGPPTGSPPESPWPPARQLWVHPDTTHGAFLEFLSWT